MAGAKTQRMEGIASIALLPGGSISGHFIQLPHSVCYGIHGTVVSGTSILFLIPRDAALAAIPICKVFPTASPLAPCPFVLVTDVEIVPNMTAVRDAWSALTCHWSFKKTVRECFYVKIRVSKRAIVSKVEAGKKEISTCCERECSRGEDYRLIKLSIMDFSTKKEELAVVECRGHDAARFQTIEHAHGWEEDVVGMVEQKHGKQKISISFDCGILKADDAAQQHLRQYLPNLVGVDAVVNIGKMSISGNNFDGDSATIEDEVAP